MRWFNRYNFPYSNFHDLNLDWIIREMNRVIEEWEKVKSEWEQMKIDWAEFQAEMQRLWQEYQDLMEAAWEAYKANLNQEWADYKDELNQAWNAYKADLNAQWQQYQTNLNNAWQQYQNSLNEWKDGVDQDIQDKFNEIDEKCAECQAAVEEAIETLNNLLVSVQQQVTDYLENLPYEQIINNAAIEWLEEHGVTVASGVILLEDYGAVGDGVTDDTDAIINAFRTAREEKKPVWLRTNKNYLSQVTITLYDGMILYGNNSTITTVDGTLQPTTGLVLFTLKNNSILKDIKSNASSITLEGNNIIIDGLDAPNCFIRKFADFAEINNIRIINSNVEMIQMNGASYIWLDNDKVNYNGFPIYLKNCTSVSISNLTKLGDNRLFDLDGSIIREVNTYPVTYTYQLANNAAIYKTQYQTIT